MYRKTKLANGIRVVTHALKQRQSVALGLWISAGGRYENDQQKGSAHFLEHMVFKGSQKYSCAEIKEKIEGVGGALNAFTADEQTCYYAKAPLPYMERALDVLADMVFFPLLQAEDVRKEKDVILEEIKMYRDLPQYLVLDLLDSLLWPNHPLGKSLIGTPESVSSVTNTGLRDFHKQYYSGQTLVVAACGDVRHKELVRLVEKKLGRVKAGAVPEFLKVKEMSRQPRVNFYRKDIEQMHVALGMPGLADEHKDKYALALLHVILGGNMSSRLFNEVREKRGLAYSISSSVKSLKDTGMFMIRAGVDNTKIVQAVDVIFGELRKIKKNGVTPGEFKRAREYYLGQVLMGLEDTLDHMLWLGEGVVSRDRCRTWVEVEREINRVKAADVHRLASSILNASSYSLAVVGPLKEEHEQKLKGLLGLAA